MATSDMSVPLPYKVCKEIWDRYSSGKISADEMKKELEIKMEAKRKELASQQSLFEH